MRWHEWGFGSPPDAPEEREKRNEKDRERRADGLLRHQQDLAEKQAEIDHLLHGNSTGVLAQQEHTQRSAIGGQGGAQHKAP
jgi:hypothetical protein